MANISEQREIHDFMNVESFSQLPFIRQTPVKEKSGAIRLFGIDFIGGGQEESRLAEKNNKKNNSNEESAATYKDFDSNNDNNSNKRFECHFCFRNFPTSQALGGHQNAHKRERQHAKRAHLQSESHVYGFVDHQEHRRYLSGSTSSYASRNNGVPAAGIYGGHGSYSSRTTTPSTPTITSNPLGLWRIPTTTPGVYATAAFSPDSAANSTWPPIAAERDVVVGGAMSSRSRYWYGAKSNVQDQVSLDLRL